MALEQPRDADAGELRRSASAGSRRCPRSDIRGEVVDLVGFRARAACRSASGWSSRSPWCRVMRSRKVFDAFELLRRGAADHAVDLVALFEQQFREVGAVLARDPRDQGPPLAHAGHLLALQPLGPSSATPRLTLYLRLPSQPLARLLHRGVSAGAGRPDLGDGSVASSSCSGSRPQASQQRRASRRSRSPRARRC